MPCGRPGGMGGAPPPGLVGTAGAGLPELGGGGGTLEPPEEPKEPVIDTLLVSTIRKTSPIHILWGQLTFRPHVTFLYDATDRMHSYKNIHLYIFLS